MAYPADMADQVQHDSDPNDLRIEALAACGFRTVEEFHERYPDGRFCSPSNHADLVEFYLHGMCAPFALALQERTGWDLVGLYSTLDSQDAPFHVLCRSPDGSLADARGTGMDVESARQGMGGGHHLLEMTRAQALRFLRHPGLHRLAAEHLDVLLPELRSTDPAP